MAIAYWCVLVAAFLPLVFTAIAKFSERGRGFSNRAPRVFQAQLSGFRARAHWAHLNSIEAFAPFAAGVLVAEQLHAPQATINLLAMAFVALRVLYGVCYLADWASARSVVWALGLACTVGLFVIGA